MVEQTGMLIMPIKNIYILYSMDFLNLPSLDCKGLDKMNALSFLDGKRSHINLDYQLQFGSNFMGYTESNYIGFKKILNLN